MGTLDKNLLQRKVVEPVTEDKKKDVETGKGKIGKIL
jgi:hypothetical protein